MDVLLSKEQGIPGGALISLGFIKKATSYSIENMYLLYIFSPEQHTYDSVVLTS
jgi:hypothetical protein